MPILIDLVELVYPLTIDSQMLEVKRLASSVRMGMNESWDCFMKIHGIRHSSIENMNITRQIIYAHTN